MNSRSFIPLLASIAAIYSTMGEGVKGKVDVKPHNWRKNKIAKKRSLKRMKKSPQFTVR